MTFSFSGCLYPDIQRAGESFQLKNAVSGVPIPHASVHLRVLEGNCMALENAATGKIIEEADLLSDENGILRTEESRTIRFNTAVFATDQRVCSRNCYRITHPSFVPVDTCARHPSASDMTDPVARKKANDFEQALRSNIILLSPGN